MKMNKTNPADLNVISNFLSLHFSVVRLICSARDSNGLSPWAVHAKMLNFPFTPPSVVFRYPQLA